MSDNDASEAVAETEAQRTERLQRLAGDTTDQIEAGQEDSDASTTDEDADAARWWTDTKEWCYVCQEGGWSPSAAAKFGSGPGGCKVIQPPPGKSQQPALFQLSCAACRAVMARDPGFEKPVHKLRTVADETGSELLIYSYGLHVLGCAEMFAAPVPARATEPIAAVMNAVADVLKEDMVQSPVPDGCVVGCPETGIAMRVRYITSAAERNRMLEGGDMSLGCPPNLTAMNPETTQIMRLSLIDPRTEPDAVITLRVVDKRPNAPPTALVHNDLVQVVRLQSERGQAMNGRQGHVVAPLDPQTGRVQVIVDGQPKPTNIKPENLILVTLPTPPSLSPEDCAVCSMPIPYDGYCYESCCGQKLCAECPGKIPGKCPFCRRALPADRAEMDT